jgi:GNAT superfamily N-acetyltransferase
MNPGRPSLFCDTALAARIERAEAGLVAEASAAAHRRVPGSTGFVTGLAGGVASFAEAGSPFNKVAGLGFGGVPEAAELAEVERAFGAFGAPVRVELAHLADPAVGALLTGRGYRLAGFENVLGRELGGDAEQVTPPGRADREPGGEPGRVAPPGAEVRLSGADELGLWLDVVVAGFAEPDEAGVPDHDEFSRDVVERAERDLVATAGVRRYLARRDGAVAGGAALRVAGRIAQFSGAATLPAHRRRGVQSALLAARLADAAAAGCDIAVVTTLPGSKSQQNVQRLGFDLLYTRAVLVRPPGPGPRHAPASFGPH